MTELVSHEVKITSIHCGCSNQPDHLVKCYTPMNQGIFITFLEVPIHVSVNQPKDDGFVTHQCLVMTLTIRDSLLVRTPVLDFPKDGAGFPIFILQLLDGLDPEIGYVHRHAVIKAQAAIFHLGCQARHAANLFCYGYRIRVHFMDNLISQRKITNGINVLMTIIIIGIVGKRLPQSMAVIEHRGDAIETEPIKMEFLQPIFTVGQQKVHHLILSIIKTQTIPCRMFASVTGTEILIRIARKITQSLNHVLDCMTMHNVHDDGHALLMGCIYQLFQFFRCTKS